MAIVKVLQIISTGDVMNVNLGFIPSRLDVVNLTTFSDDAGTGLGSAQWYSTMANGSALLTDVVAGAPTISYSSADGVTPFQSNDASLWVETIRVITGISNAAQAQITSLSHGFTSADVGVTTVTISGVVGMPQINTLRGVIQSIVDADNFTVNINTTSFGSYVSGGQANVITGIPPFTQAGYQIFNTPQRNNGFIGVTLGVDVIGGKGDILLITAFLDAAFTSD